jgi:hypothetical protein
MDQIEEATAGFIIYFDELVKPRCIFHNASGILSYQADESGLGIVLPDAFECRRCHDNIADPVGTDNQDGLGMYLLVF